jgi:hypothetical protein
MKYALGHVLKKSFALMPTSLFRMECGCIPALCKNIISYSCLEEVDGYEIITKNKHCSIYYNDIFYAHCLLVNGLYVFDLENKSVYNINMKWARLNDLNLTFI